MPLQSNGEMSPRCYAVDKWETSAVIPVLVSISCVFNGSLIGGAAMPTWPVVSNVHTAPLSTW